MGLSPEDSEAVLDYLRERLREALPGVDEQIAASFEWTAEPSRNLAYYLSGLVSFLRTNTPSFAHKVRASLADVVSYKGDPREFDLRIQMTGPDRERYRTDVIRLEGDPALEELVAGLLRLKGDLFEDLRAGGQG